MNYPHLSREERFTLQRLDAQGMSYRYMARALGRHPSTIAREFKRNCPGKEYVSSEAHDLAFLRKSRGHQRPRLKDESIKRYTEAQLKEGWTPQQIAGALRLERNPHAVSHEAIYQWLYNERPDLCVHLCYRRNNRHPRGYSRRTFNSVIPGRVDITQRPEHINQRKTYGHWEVDLMLGKAGSSLAVLVCVERKTGYVHLERLNNKSPRIMRWRLQRFFQTLPKRLRQTVTYDNGFENRDHYKLNAALNMKSYFCAPYRSWEKGTVENTIGLIRRFIPKGTDLSTISRSQIKRIEQKLNSRPRKRYKFHNPQELFNRVALNA